VEEFSFTMERDGESGLEELLILVSVLMVKSGLLINNKESIDGLVVHLLPDTEAMVDGARSMEKQ
jgi:hypothetical protein